jgi:uncharacterized iron-regulated membrane protein
VLRLVRAGLFSVALISIVGGVIVLATKTIIILPILHWIQSLQQEQMDMYVSVWGRFLIGIGIVLFFVSGFMMWMRKRRAT